jgi:hypothetical protein
MFTKTTLYTLFIAAAIATPPAHAGFFGPDHEPLSPVQIGERLQREPVSFAGGGKALEIRTKAAAIGGFIVGAILSSAAASGSVSGANNAAQMQQQMQANMQIAQQANVHIQGAVNQLSAEAAGAAAAEVAQRGPLPLLVQTLNGALREQQAQLADANAEPKPALALRLSQTEWKLDFETFSSDYVLKTALTLELLDKAADKLHLRATCQQEYPKKMELDDWERDDHLAIAQAAEEIARGCHAQFATVLNLAAANAAATPTAAGPERAATPEAAAIAIAPNAAEAPSVTEGSSNEPALASN